MSVADVLAVVERDRAFYDESGGGVTFSGGEPLAQPEFLLALLRRCRAVGIHTAVDTSGYVATGTLLRIATATDLFLFDIKTIDDERHIRATGVSNRTIRENLRHLADSGASIMVRIPLIPGVNDDEAELRRLAGLLATMPGIRQVALLPFHPSARRKYLRLGMDNPMSGVPQPSPERVAAAIDILTESGLTVQTGG